jgi:hypothetical protein
MKLFNRAFGEYFQFTKIGIYLLALVAVARFLMKPVLNIPYAQGTFFTSVTILLPILMIVYTIRANAAGLGSYRDLLGIAAVLTLSTAVMIMLAIAVDDFGGIETYYTDPAEPHKGVMNPFQHMGGHLLFGLISTLVMWGIGALTHFIIGLTRKKAMA